MLKKLEDKFNHYCNSEKFEINRNQIIVIKKLQEYYNKNFKSVFSKFFSRDYSKKGFYLYGGVGVGKTMILNFFFNHLKEKKIRLHFNEFMLNFHNFTHEKKNKKEQNLTSLFVKNLRSKASLIYFDEFQVTNIVDAMILGKLFEVIFSENIRIIITTNTKLSELYMDGLQREQFLPFISIIKEYSIQKELSLKDDYRLKDLNTGQRIFFPLNESTLFMINKSFRESFFSRTCSFKIRSLCFAKLKCARAETSSSDIFNNLDSIS